MGRRGFLTCLAPFHLEENSDSATQNEATASFAALEYDIRKLQKGISGNSLTLQWCTETLVLLKKLHSEFLMLFHSLKVSMSWNGITKLLDEYMNESLNILELCNLLKSATSEMNRYRLKIDIAVRSMYYDEYLAKIQKLDRGEKKLYDTLKLRRVEILKVMPKKKFKNSKANAISAIKGAITVISSMLCCAILFPVRVKVDEEIHSQPPQMKSFLNSVQDLARCFNNNLFQMTTGNFFVAFVEYEMIEKAIRDTKDQLKEHAVVDGEMLEISKVSIQQKSTALGDGLQVFELEVSKVFEEVLRGRNKLLQQITEISTTARCTI